MWGWLRNHDAGHNRSAYNDRSGSGHDCGPGYHHPTGHHGRSNYHRPTGHHGRSNDNGPTNANRPTGHHDPAATEL